MYMTGKSLLWLPLLTVVDDKDAYFRPPLPHTRMFRSASSRTGNSSWWPVSTTTVPKPAGSYAATTSVNRALSEPTTLNTTGLILCCCHLCWMCRRVLV